MHTITTECESSLLFIHTVDGIAGSEGALWTAHEMRIFNRKLYTFFNNQHITGIITLIIFARETRTLDARLLFNYSHFDARQKGSDAPATHFA